MGLTYPQILLTQGYSKFNSKLFSRDRVYKERQTQVGVYNRKHHPNGNARRCRYDKPIKSGNISFSDSLYSDSTYTIQVLINILTMQLFTLHSGCAWNGESLSNYEVFQGHLQLRR
ncbi:hypothetical protein AVEN_83975-1 [Araneus ventricosus]|uniref:Uncharacterized protein n=1 Tax=Araneus ventricosus TaxID=182803 RepID=A0A4Y2BSJ7_ARAVE|nr:hypothetical protein AVEN_83975-1 [Araneus ventricosus]